MTLRFASLIDQIVRRNATTSRPAATPADPFERLARIVRAERAREAAVPRVPVMHQAG